MDIGTGRNILQRKCITDSDFYIFSGKNCHSNSQSFRSQDVAFFTVRINQKGDIGAAVRIIFDGGNLCRNSIFVSLKVNDTIKLLGTAAMMTDSDFAVVVAACRVLDTNSQRFFRRALGDLFKGRARHVSPRSCIRLISSDSHYKFLLSIYSILCGITDLNKIRCLQKIRCLCFPVSGSRWLSWYLPYGRSCILFFYSCRDCSWC